MASHFPWTQSVGLATTFGEMGSRLYRSWHNLRPTLSLQCFFPTVLPSPIHLTKTYCSFKLFLISQTDHLVHSLKSTLLENKSKSVLHKSGLWACFFTLLPSLITLNSTISRPLQPRLPLTSTLPTRYGQLKNTRYGRGMQHHFTANFIWNLEQTMLWKTLQSNTENDTAGFLLPLKRNRNKDQQEGQYYQLIFTDG